MYNGLSEKEVQERIDQGQINVSEERMADSVSGIIRRHTLTYFNLINTVLFLIVLLSGSYRNGLFYMTVIINTVMGIWQEIKARALLKKMTIMNTEPVQVKRGGQWQSIQPDQIVADDLIKLSAGMQVPADAIVLDGVIEANESILTGESEPVRKRKDRPLYAGTFVTAGSALCKVTRVGSARVSSVILKEGKKYRRSPSILSREITALLKVISICIIPAGILIYFTLLLRTGLSWQESAVKMTAALVGMIPEGLVVLTSAALVVSTIRLSRRNVLVQDLFSIESLARADVLCLDKTGTLTSGKMNVTKVICLNQMEESEIQKIIPSFLASMPAGNATSEAMNDYFGKDAPYNWLDRLPFSSERKFSGCTLETAGTVYLGAPQFLSSNTEMLAKVYEYSKQGIRVLMLAGSDEPLIKDGFPSHLKPMALIALKDQLRPNTREIMEYFNRQDVQLKVISGDDPVAVSAIALEAGIPNADKYLDMHGSEPDYDRIVSEYTVFGRVLPNQKKELVAALQRQGHTVAMTGDGVNDVPSLKAADVSAAMASGAPAARDSANFVLLDSDFARMPEIVDEGRRVINNISRASSMYLVKTGFSVLLSLYVIVLGHAYPFVPIQLTLISALGVGIPTAILQLEPSFERVKGGFLSAAFSKSAPSSFAVMLTVFACLYLQSRLNLSSLQYCGILVFLTGYIYLYTLYRVYQPVSKLRLAVICTMGIMLACAILFAGSIFSAKLDRPGIPAIIAGIVLIPLLIGGLDWIYQKTAGRFLVKLTEKTYGNKNTG